MQLCSCDTLLSRILSDLTVRFIYAIIEPPVRYQWSSVHAITLNALLVSSILVLDR